MMMKPSLSRRCFSASTSDRLGMNLIAPSSGRCGLRYWIITRVILRRRHVVECARDNRSGIGSEITHVGAGRRIRLRSNSLFRVIAARAGSRMSRFRTYRRLAIDDINWPVLSTPDSGAVPGRSGYLVAPPGRILTSLSDLLSWWQTLSMAMQELPQMKWDQQKVIG